MDERNDEIIDWEERVLPRYGFVAGMLFAATLQAITENWEFIEAFLLDLYTNITASLSTYTDMVSGPVNRSSTLVSGLVYRSIDWCRTALKTYLTNLMCSAVGWRWGLIRGNMVLFYMIKVPALFIKAWFMAIVVYCVVSCIVHFIPRHFWRVLAAIHPRLDRLVAVVDGFLEVPYTFFLVFFAFHQFYLAAFDFFCRFWAGVLGTDVWWRLHVHFNSNETRSVMMSMPTGDFD